MELIILVIGLIALGLLAMRFGAESRDGFVSSAYGRDVSAMNWTDPAYEQELARQIQQARRKRLTRTHVAAAPHHQSPDDLAEAA